MIWTYEEREKKLKESALRFRQWTSRFDLDELLLALHKGLINANEASEMINKQMELQLAKGVEWDVKSPAQAREWLAAKGFQVAPESPTPAASKSPP